MRMNMKYLVAVALLAVLAVVFGLASTVAPSPEPILSQQELSSSSDSVTHFTYPPTFDSGWMNITGKRGQYFTLRHGLGTTDVIVDLRGKQSQDPEGGALEWNMTYGGPGEDIAYSVVQTDDGGYAIAGYTSSYGAGSFDFWLVKIDSAGNLLWNKTYGGIWGESAYCVVQASDGGYAIAGRTSSFDVGGGDFWLVKTDSAGNLLWNKTYGEGNPDIAYSVVQTDDGGYAIAGFTYSYGASGGDFLLVRTDSNGNVLWNKTYGRTWTDAARSVIQTSDEGYALAGYTYTPITPVEDFWLVKTDSAGNMQWNKTYGAGSYDIPYSVVETFDGGYAIAGRTSSFGAGADDFWLVKTDSFGNMLWNKTYGGTKEDIAYSVVQTVDGGYAIGGYTRSFGSGWNDFWLVKVDSSGNMLWNKTYGGTVEEWAYSLVQTSDGGYALAGFIDYDPGPAFVNDIWLVKVNVEMNREHQRNLGDSETGLAWTGLTNSTITIYRGETDPYWNFVRVRIWVIKEPTWQFGDINQDGVVNAQDLYIVSKNYGKTFSALSLTGIIGIAGIHTYKKRKKQPE